MQNEITISGNCPVVQRLPFTIKWTSKYISSAHQKWITRTLFVWFSYTNFGLMVSWITNAVEIPAVPLYVRNFSEFGRMHFGADGGTTCGLELRCISRVSYRWCSEQMRPEWIVRTGSPSCERDVCQKVETIALAFGKIDASHMNMQ